MKTVVRFFCTVVLVVLIFFPWLLRLLDLGALIIIGRGVTSVNWWGSVWADGDYWAWPFYAVVIFVFSGLIWMGMETKSGKGMER